jgi:D-glycero-alpha-D-manno-heptose-7-phosphate kinase
LLKSLFAHRKRHLHQEELAALACHIEIDRLGEPVGKQDQYIAAVGGITCFTFHKNDKVTATPLKINMDTLFDLEDNLLLFFTGFSRSAGSILQDQNTKTKDSDAEMLKNLHYVKELGYRSRDALESGNPALFGELMHEHWEHKKRRSGGMSNPKIDEWYQLAMANGVVGAGGGGFLMFYARDRNLLRHTMAHAGLEEVRFRFDFEGSKIVLSS